MACNRFWLSRRSRNVVCVGEILRRRTGALGSVLLETLALIDGAGELVGLLPTEPTGEQLEGDLGSDDVLGQILAVYDEKSDGKLYGGPRGIFWSC